MGIRNYETGTEQVTCEACDEAFDRRIEDGWKKLCLACYREKVQNDGCAGIS